MATPYEQDIIAWAQEQAALLRAGQLSALDVEHIAEEIEDVGKSEQRELASRVALLIAHLIKWQYQPERRGNSWKTTLTIQRASILRRLKKTPSLKPMLIDEEWLSDMWGDACQQAADEMQISIAMLPNTCPWSDDQLLAQDFFPD